MRVEPNMDGIGGTIAKVVVDVAATNAFNATVWQANANKNLLQYRTNPNGGVVRVTGTLSHTGGTSVLSDILTIDGIRGRDRLNG